MLEHGGKLRAAARCYGIPLADWLDLSTGINPNGWPVPNVPTSMWSRLPEDDDELENAALVYYGTKAILPVAGSQAAIQALPRLRAFSRVGILYPSYNEHAHAWARAGHNVVALAVDAVDAAVADLDVLVLIHPNNPTGARFQRDTLLRWHEQLAARGGWLIVDEAFMDATPEQSLAACSPQSGLIVLRSLGKFFGLAGARVGFAIAEPILLARLNALLGPWTVAGPARWLATQALRDHAWREAARYRLVKDSARLAALLATHGLAPNGSCALFQWICTSRAAELHDRLARRGILARRFDDPASLRFGLPGNEPAWKRLDAALLTVCRTENREVVA
jgi:cobalamin biosynthetic protein CobC